MDEIDESLNEILSREKFDKILQFIGKHSLECLTEEKGENLLLKKEYEIYCKVLNNTEVLSKEEKYDLLLVLGWIGMQSISARMVEFVKSRNDGKKKMHHLW